MNLLSEHAGLRYYPGYFDRGGQAAPADPMQKTHALVGAADLAQHVERAVARVVVDEHDFPVEAGETAIEPRHQFADIVALVEGRNDDRQARQLGAAMRIGPMVFGYASEYLIG